MNTRIEEILIYSGTFLICAFIVYLYLRSEKKKSQKVKQKLKLAKEEGRFEPLSLHPYIDLKTCIGSGACITACPEKDILGVVDGKATVINTSNCIGHGACFHACPVEAISLRIGTESRGVELPHVDQNYETNIGGIYIAGELGGMGLIKNSVEQGKQAVENIVKNKIPNKEGILDLVIIGAGPAGISASLAAKKHGLSFITLEQDSLGGTVFTFPRKKVVMTHPMHLPLRGKVKLYDTSKDELLTLWKEVLNDQDIKIQEQKKVDKIVPIENELFKILCSDGEEFLSQHVLIAIGRRGSPRKLNIPGEMLEKVAYRLIEAERIEGKKILVVGGGDSAVESALLLMDNNEVCLSYRKETFARIKSKNQQAIQKAIEEKKLTVLLSSNLIEIKNNEVLIRINGGDIQNLPNDLVYIFIGGELPVKFLKNAGIEIKKRFGHIMKKH